MLRAVPRLHLGSNGEGLSGMAGGQLSRRGGLKLGGGVVLGGGLLPLLGADEAVAADPLPHLTGWIDDGDKVVLGTPSTDWTQQTQHVALMPVADKLTTRYDSWYLWVWTHDEHICRL